MPFVRSGGNRIYWKVEGEATSPALVLLNSIGTDMDLWAPALPALRRRFGLLRIDTRGHGASDAPPGDYDMAGLAADVGAAMEAAGVASAAVAGVSLGGMIAMQAALDAPARVSALALVCTSATMDRDAWSGRVATVRDDGMAGIVDLAMGRFLSPAFVAERPEVAATVRRGLLAIDPSGYAGCGAAIRDMALADRLGGIGCRTLVVTGTRDTSTPYDGHGEHLLARIPNARHVALDAAHLAPLEAPDPLAAALIDFLA
ncbi:MAG: alpha/beta fold hydrolase [Janthinobacterium lividum]